MKDFLAWVSGNLALAVAIVAAITTLSAGIWTIAQYALARRAEAKKAEFETYHDLIKRLVSPEAEGQTMYLDRQVAVIFELRKFASYRPVSIRILTGLKATWEKSDVRLGNEIDHTIKYLELREILRKVDNAMYCIGFVTAVILFIRWVQH